MKNIILILTLNIVFLSSMWNCNDKFNEVCEEYPQLIKNLFKPLFNEDDNIITTKIIPPTDDDIRDIKKGLWALFEITLVDNIVMEKVMDNNVIALESIVNSDFLKLNRHLFFSLFMEENIPNKVYLFVSDINTNYETKGATSLFKECNNIKEINVVICFDSPKKQKHCINFLFSGSEKLEKVSLENLNLNCLYSTCLFNNCEKLKEIRFQKFNGDKENLNWLPYTFSDFTRNNDEIPIKISCTGHFLYLFIAQWEYIYDQEKSFWEDEEGKKYIYEHKDELKNSDCYRDFTIYFKRKHNE